MQEELYEWWVGIVASRDRYGVGPHDSLKVVGTPDPKAGKRRKGKQIVKSEQPFIDVLAMKG